MKSRKSTGSKNHVRISDVVYNYTHINNSRKKTTSIKVIGIDTEADDKGRCFLIATSEFDFWEPHETFTKFFSRRYRGCNFVSYNLKYDEGAILQVLDMESLEELRIEGKCEFEGYVIKSIPSKMLSVRRGKNTVHIYDMYNFYGGSLNYNAKKYLGEEKEDIDTKTFTSDIIKRRYCEIAWYCIKDAVLVEKLGNLIISKFEKFGVYPQKLYSTAYISYQYFQKSCNYITVKRFWEEDKKLIQYAMYSYNGGKFEVTEKGTGHYYEYDIVSAYPYEIANLIDISNSRVVWSNKYRRFATYGFIYCKMKIPDNVYSPVPIKYGTVNIYPTGEIETYITKSEYEYLINQGVDITIINAVWMHIDKKIYPYKKEIEKLVRMKQNIDKEKDALDYHTIKIFLNSLYGKMVQLIKMKKNYIASNCWNPIYASIITANCRLKVTSMQQMFPDIIAVHTDSLISKSELPIECGRNLGQWDFEVSGQGYIVGSGIYQIGDKTKFRGFRMKNSLIELMNCRKKYIELESVRPYTWKEVVFHNWEKEMINRFSKVEKKLNINFDKKRIWLNDYKYFNEIFLRNVESLPLDAGLLRLL